MKHIKSAFDLAFANHAIDYAKWIYNHGWQYSSSIDTYININNFATKSPKDLYTLYLETL